MWLAVKESFFNRLQALNESSDEEYESNEVREVVRNCKKTTAAHPSIQRIRTLVNLKRAPALQRATSAPVSSVSLVKETPPLLRQQPLLRDEIATPSTSLDASVVEETPSAHSPSSIRPRDRRTVSTPSIGTTDLVLNYSTGIESMLGKKGFKGKERKERKEQPIIPVPVDERLFKDLTFYYYPPNEKTPRRKLRIKRGREFGAVWAEKNWTPETVTHVIVENKFGREEVMKHLNLKPDTWPSKVYLVNENYQFDCVKYKKLLNPQQILYQVKSKSEAVNGEHNHRSSVSQTSDQSLEIKPSNNEPAMSSETSPPYQNSLQNILDEAQPDVHPPEKAWLQHKSGDEFVESPTEASQVEFLPNKRQRLSAKGDELDQAIGEAKGMKYIPLGDDDDEDDDSDLSRPSSRDGPESTDSDKPYGPESKKEKKKGSTGFNQDAFTCMSGGSGNAHGSNPNARTIEVLEEMLKYYERTRDKWRVFAYKKALGTLKKQQVRITNYDQAIKINTIGHRLALKIEEIYCTNRLRQLDSAIAEPHDQILGIFINIYGVGINQAWKWVLQGHKTLEDLKQRVHLTASQKIGIDKYDDLLTRIPRDEVTALGEFVKTAAARFDPDVQVIIGGSYRRGAPNSGDIDCLLTKPGTRVARDLLSFLHQLVNYLTNTGFLVAALAVTSKKGSASKWHGCCVLPGAGREIWRRIDFLVVPATELGAALIYFTGDDIFNRSIRLLSSWKGWRLNQRGLYKDVMRGAERVKLTEGTLMEGADEKKIFEMLGVPFRPPHERICR